MTKREAQDAIYLLMSLGKVEYAWPTTQPLTYKESS